MGLGVDEHRDLDRQALLELRAALAELAGLNGVHVVEDLTPALFIALKSPCSASTRLAAFDAEVSEGRKNEAERGLREHEQRQHDAAVRDAAAAAEARASRAAAAEFARQHRPGTKGIRAMSLGDIR